MSASLRKQPLAQGSGGLFSTQKVSFSAETQKLLKGQSPVFCTHSLSKISSKWMNVSFLYFWLTRVEFHLLCSCSVVMMEESKLTNFQQRQLREKMQSKFSLETHRNLWAYKLYFVVTSLLVAMQPLPLRCNPTSSKQGGPPPRRQPKSKSKSPHRGGGLRSKEAIEKMTDREPEYRPPPCSEW